MNKTTKCDVLVVGAGPAGVSAAFFLKYLDKNNSFEVTLAERLNWRKYYTYHRMCGEAISKKAFQELKPLKPNHIVDNIDCITESYPGGLTLKNKLKGYVLNRSLFFKSIIKKFESLGGNFLINNVIAVENKKNKVLVRFSNGDEKYYDYVIASDGASSGIRKLLGVKGGQVKPFIQYITRKKVSHKNLTFIYGEKYKGDYKWIFPNGSTTKIGFPLNCQDKISLSPLKKQIRLIGFGGIEKLVKGRVLFVGDAACQTNPITKGGIRPAMVAGKIVADLILGKDIAKYGKKWSKTPYANEGIFKVFSNLKNLSDVQLEKFIKEISTSPINSNNARTLKIFDLCSKYGW